ncbi:diaminopimelate decarboxylase [Paenibacillus marchantiophytorum]|uniref:Diaminopimelate decarboxylase n=1 Tax=Paenibacillus marchantiophytorum TaxID=1619310 RepID=A0ABQ2BSF6_9BACL|nr:type III PLP-dependent enzyme [Paenibacillus marchantiophytorum]GGI46485.1 diaminopimelate decarboxylase [Paenibacillus marchantiophytorum]
MNQHIWKNIANIYGTPAYIYDGNKIAQQYELLKNCLPEPFEIFYSVKSNPLLGICQLFKKLGSCIEVASSGELYMALVAGFHPSQIIFTSPGKTCEDLLYAIETGIYSINVESVEEAKLIHQLASDRQRKVNISLRINPNFNINGAGMKMTGVPTQFGIDQSILKETMDIIQALPSVRIRGIHIFSGSQMLDADHIVLTVDEIMKLAVDLMDTYHFQLDFLDLGGGFGIPYFKGESYLEMDRLQGGLSEVWGRYKKRLDGVRIGVESGRFLLAEAGSFMTKVLYVKESKGSKYIVCDGGSNQHASTAFLGRYVRNNFPMRLLEKEGNLEEVNVVGSLCTPTDVLGQKVMLPIAEPGDLLIIDKSGAYGLTHSPVLFLSHVLPPEIICLDGEITVLRERGHYADFLRGQHSFC